MLAKVCASFRSPCLCKPAKSGARNDVAFPPLSELLLTCSLKESVVLRIGRIRRLRFIFSSSQHLTVYNKRVCWDGYLFFFTPFCSPSTTMLSTSNKREARQLSSEPTSQERAVSPSLTSTVDRSAKGRLVIGGEQRQAGLACRS